ncbi:TIGR04219 family outer membrane beta-barrel protein [Sulfurimonas sp. HSL-3221]|uniref:TIGR04219 family outer membrane beta-barrel protein n=1 Tax=Sulfurimonadaceae TaxID=2771471 RepID=UPI001E3682E4|nr:TIGR04219 family outer membrane beta-barrel protein [Sulfurimonas sp. HSL-3221]UFS61310.1 TIGR04219 family outer membrane beta-barrel protein [Sulfurimonas sp. HSL-3221]
MTFFSKPILLCALFATALQAFETDVETGVGVWYAKASGDLTYNDSGGSVSSVGDLGYKDEYNFYIFADFKPREVSPFVPNLRLAYTSIAYNGRTKSSVTWGPFLYQADAPNKVSAEEYDATFYYTFENLLSWASFDAGINVKYVTTRYTIDDSSFHYDESDVTTLPQLYLHASIPVMQLPASVELSYYYYDEGSFTLYDFRLAGRYDFGTVATHFMPSIELGYRMHRLWLQKKSYNTKIDLLLKGFYLEGSLHF